MSAWYVLSSMGIYAVTPGRAEWIETKPFFEKIKINFEDGKSELLSINTNKSRLGIVNTKYNFVKPKNPESIIPVPVIQAESKSFKDKMTVEIFSQNPKDTIYYIYFEKDVDYSTFKMTYVPYSKPFYINNTTTISAYVKRDLSRQEVSATFFKKPNNYTIDIKSKYNPQYHAGGNEGLIDGIYGTENWRKGDWQGYQSQDFEAVVDLQKEITIHSIGATFLQDSRSWILMPTKVEYYVSNDNINFTLAGTIENTIDPKETENKIKNFSLDKELKAKYVKVKAFNFGKLPEWHQGFGGDAFIFIDEITIK